MEELVKSLYKSYGIYVNTEKMIPSSVDGTIPIWKRLLLGAHTIAKDQFVKSATLFGYVIGHWHPHSEAIQGTAQILVSNGFLDGKGNWGSDIGVEPTECAAPRYTSLKINKNIDELCFKYIKDVDWVPSELEPEPIYLPTPVPLCLMAKSEFNSIGFGIKTEIPCYKYKDLVNRLKYLLKLGPKVIIKPYIKGCKILSKDKDLENLLTKHGRHAIEIQGIYEIDHENCRIYIRGWSPRITFQSLFDRISKSMNGEVLFVDESSEKVGTKVRIESTRVRNKQDSFEKLVRVVDEKLKAKLTYQIFVATPNKKVLEFSVDEYLLNAYNHYSLSVSRFVQRRRNELNKLIRDYEMIEKLRKYISNVSSAKNEEEYTEIIRKLSGQTNIPEDEIHRLFKEYRIQTMLTAKMSTANIKEQMEKITEENLKHEFFDLQID